MTTSIQSPADAVNIALTRVGYKGRRVGNLYDGSAAAIVALDIYGQTRDAMQRDNDYGFCERNISLTLLKQAPAGGYFPPTAWSGATNPPPPWLFSYAYPSDALKIRAIKRQPAFIPNYDPRYNRYSIDNDIGFSPPVKVILTDIPNAIIVYTGQITDPNEWDDGFLEVFADALGKALGPVLMGLDAFKIAAASEQQDAALAEVNKERG